MAPQNRRSPTNDDLLASGHNDSDRATLGFSSAPIPLLDPRVAEVLDYLQHGFSAYPFNPKLDNAFILSPNTQKRPLKNTSNPATRAGRVEYREAVTEGQEFLSEMESMEGNFEAVGAVGNA